MKTIIVPVSGGKDSEVCLSLALKTGTPVIACYQDTGFEHLDTYQQLDDMETFYGVKINRIKSARYESVPDLMVKQQMIPSGAARVCTRDLKQGVFRDWLTEQGACAGSHQIWFGMRADEGVKRGKKYAGLSPEDSLRLGDLSIYSSAQLRDIVMKLPIVDWSTGDVFQYLAGEGAPVNPLYARGHRRVGCYPCVFASRTEWRLVAKTDVGRAHIVALLDAEERINIARAGYNRTLRQDFDVRALLREQAETQGLFDDDEEQGGCAWCQM